MKAMTTMIRGVGMYRSMQGKNAQAAQAIQDAVSAHVQQVAATSPLARATVVMDGNHVVLVEEWESLQEYQQAVKSLGVNLQAKLAPLVKEPLVEEFFPHALHIHKPLEPGAYDGSRNDIGILVRQATSSPTNGEKLRDAQREAYERQMGKEPGCTCCIILSGSTNALHQVRIIELWKTMQDFYFHESSEWHARGEEKVVPLVTDMDCDFVQGKRLLVNDKAVGGL